MGPCPGEAKSCVGDKCATPKHDICAEASSRNLSSSEEGDEAGRGFPGRRHCMGEGGEGSASGPRGENAAFGGQRGDWEKWAGAAVPRQSTHFLSLGQLPRNG